MHVAYVQPDVPNREYSTVGYAAFIFLRALLEAGHEVAAVLPLPEQASADSQTRARWLEELAALGVETRVLRGDPPPRTFRFRGAGRLDRLRRLVAPRV